MQAIATIGLDIAKSVFQAHKASLWAFCQYELLRGQCSAVANFNIHLS
jgi:hypothetical protein